jgi:hypothetical protein
MPITLIPCRLKADHTVTAEMAESALQHFPAWERVPTSDQPGTAEQPAEQPREQTQPPAPDSASAETRKAVRKQATSSDKE